MILAPSILRILSHALWMFCALLVLLYCTSLIDRASCWGVFLMLALVSWPIWQYRTEYLLFRRQLVLEGVMQPASLVRKMLWKGRIMRALQVLVSLLLAWLLLVLVSQLSMTHWWLLALDVLLLALIHEPFRHALAGTVNVKHLGTVVRRWPVFLVNGLVLTLAFMVIDFSVVAVPDTRMFSWSELAVITFLGQIYGAACPLWGVSSGVVGTVEALAWHGSQVIIPDLPDIRLQYLAWGFFLLRAATIAWLVTALLLGVCSVLDQRALRRQGRRTGSTLSTAFIVTILLLAVPFFYASLKLNDLMTNMNAQSDVAPDAPLDICQSDPLARAGLLAQLDEDVAVTRVETTALIEAEAIAGVNDLFAGIEQGVDQYLDWYFTVLGEYQRLAAVFTDDVATAMREQLYDHLFAGSGFDQRLATLDLELSAAVAARFAGLLPRLQDGIEQADCATGGLSTMPLSMLNNDSLRASVAASSGVGAGLVTSKLLASKTTTAVIGKVAAKKSFQTGAAVASKALAKKGSSTLLSAGIGTAFCALTGPVAILCGITAGLVTWFTVDKALVEIDEALNREEMRADIIAVLQEQKGILSDQLVSKHLAAIDHMALQVDEAIDKVFLPASDGLGSNVSRP